MTAAQIGEFLLGAAVVVGVLLDLFKSVVLPRPAPARIRLSLFLVAGTWRLWRWTGIRLRSADRREGFLGSFGPFVVLLLLAVGIIGLVAGYGLMLDALRDQIQPRPHSLGTVLYFSALSLLTLGFGDIVPVGTVARIVVLVEAVNGLGVVALVISFLFSLYGSFQRREVMVVNLEASAGAPPSGLAMLETYRKLEMVEDLGRVLGEWRMWSAEVLESHLAYPLLAYFRSSHDNESWVSALGAVLDAATLIVTTIEGVPRGPARLTLQVGGHLVEDLARYFQVDRTDDVGVERFEFDEARRRLEVAGYRLTEAEGSWTSFSYIRSRYAGPLNEMARNWTTPPAQWIGDRSYVRHHGSPKLAIPQTQK